jgi:hypothetical protein
VTFLPQIALLALLPLAGVVLGGALRGVVVVAAEAYAVAVVLVYPAHVAPVYGYAHLIDAGPSTGLLLLAVAVAAAPALWLSIPARRPSTIVLWVLYLIGYIPAIIIPLFLTGDPARVLPYDAALFGSMVVVGVIVRLPPADLRAPALSLRAFTQLLVGLSLLSLIYTAAAFGIHPPPSLADVYGTRERFATAIPASLGGGYIVPWAANAINPMLMALGIARRRAALWGLGLAGQALIYSTTGFKTTFFSVALVPAVYAAVAVSRRSFALVATLGAAAIFALALLPPTASRESVALSTRTYVTPAQVNSYYYDFFSTHPPYHLSHSILSGVTRRPYVQEPPELIGPIYFAPYQPHANADLWADAFANFRYLGIAGFTLVFGALLLIADGLGRRCDLRVAGPMLAVAGLSLSNSALLTTVLTSGFALGCLLMAVAPPVIGRSTAGAAREARRRDAGWRPARA